MSNAKPNVGYEICKFGGIFLYTVSTGYHHTHISFKKDKKEEYYILVMLKSDGRLIA